MALHEFFCFFFQKFLYSSRHNHALRRSREGSGRFVGGPIDAETLEEETSEMSVPLATTQPDLNKPITANQLHISASKETHQHDSTDHSSSNGMLDSSHEREIVSSSDNRETVIASTTANS